MMWETHPVMAELFEDFTHCWWLSHRLQAAQMEQLGGGGREQEMRRFCERELRRGS